MIAAENESSVEPERREQPDALAIIGRHLASENAVIRCAAARALGALDDQRVAQLLVPALMDEDPDVRTDAMAGLAHCAGSAEAEALRRSLVGDPVKEVKISAITGLARLKDTAALPLLRTLASERADAAIAWEDEAGLWDDWLDVQIAALTALGNMSDSAAVEIILSATRDEMGQELEGIAYAALAKIPDGGTATLLGLLRDPSEKSRRAALLALMTARSSILEPMADLFARDASPQVRSLSLRCMLAGNPCLEQLIADEASDVRAATVDRFGAERSDLVQIALGDANETVRAIALERASRQPEPPDDIFANAAVWLKTARPALAIACIEAMARLNPDAAHPDLVQIAAEPQREPEVRVAALTSLSRIPAEDRVTHLEHAICDPVRQVRTAALSGLANCIAEGTPEARQAEEILAAAIDGSYSEKLTARTPGEEQATDLGASRVEGSGNQRIRLSPDGEIIEEDASDNQTEDADYFPRSTLDQIQDQNERAPTDSTLTPTKRRRVAVDGPDDFASDLQLNAITVAGAAHGEALAKALTRHLSDQDGIVRAAAFRSVLSQVRAERRKIIDPAEISAGLEDTDPNIRADAATILARLGGFRQRLAARIDDPDPLVRAICLRAVMPDRPDLAFRALRDNAATVRRTAINEIVRHCSVSEIRKAIRISIDEGEVAGLRTVSGTHASARSACLEMLETTHSASRDTLALLDAMTSDYTPIFA